MSEGLPGDEDRVPPESALPTEDRDGRPGGRRWEVVPEISFLGWGVPLLSSAVAWLSAPGRLPSDASDDGLSGGPILVVPGQRAARRLMEALAVELAGPHFLPPRIMTPGRLLDELLQPSVQVATEVERLLAWRLALKESPELELRDLFGPGVEEATGDLAAEVRRVADELGLEGLSLKRARGRLGEAEQGVEERRWEVLERLESRYHDVLSRSELRCPHATRLHTLLETQRRAQGGGVPSGPDVVLIGVAELQDSYGKL